MEKLSVVIITLNEERNISRAIQSVQSVADEVIVVDSFSTDRTAEIVKELGATFIQKEWAGYSETKNYANLQAKYEYILSLDADEALDAELKDQIAKVKAQGFTGTYSVNRLTNYCGKWIRHSGWYPDRKIRIFPKSSTKWIGAYVHEELEFEEELPNTELGGHLEHYSYYDYIDHRLRADKYSVLTATKLHEKGEKAGILRPWISATGRFVSMYILKLGFLDGWMGFKIAQISAQSNVLKYRELRRLNREDEDSK